jgi:hypothetical protein
VLDHDYYLWNGMIGNDLLHFKWPGVLWKNVVRLQTPT